MHVVVQHGPVQVTDEVYLLLDVGSCASHIKGQPRRSEGRRRNLRRQAQQRWFPLHLHVRGSSFACAAHEASCAWKRLQPKRGWYLLPPPPCLADCVRCKQPVNNKKAVKMIVSLGRPARLTDPIREVMEDQIYALHEIGSMFKEKFSHVRPLCVRVVFRTDL